MSMRSKHVLLVLSLLLGATVVTLSQGITIPNTFVNGTVADATQVNANFTALANNALNRNGGTQNGTLLFTDALYTLGDATHRVLDGFFSRDVNVGRQLVLSGSTSGTLTVKAAAIAGATTLTLPGGTTDFSATGGTSQYVKQASAGAALTVGALAEADLPTFVDYTDYSSTSTVTGWSSTTTKDIRYKKIGKLVWVNFWIEGTSNATAVSFTLPVAAVNVGVEFNFASGYAVDNGAVLTRPAYCRLVKNTSTVDCLPSFSTAWTGSGSKTASGQFWYQSP